METDFYRNLQRENPDTSIIDYDNDSGIGFIAKKDTQCILLHENLCLIHSVLGTKAKSYCCRTFPLVFGILPGELYVGVSYYCPSVQENKGKPINDLLSLVRELAEIGVNYDEFPDSAKLTDEVSISWDSYNFIESFIRECINQSGAPMGTWEALSAVAALNVIKTDRREFTADKEEVEGFFTYPVPVLMQRTPEFVQYQLEFCANIIAVAESGEETETEKEEVSNTVLNGGSLKSSAFGEFVTVAPLWEYLSIKTPVWIYNEFVKYFDNVIFRKQILSFSSIYSGLVSLHFLPMLFSWYANVSALLKDRVSPEQEDFYEAMGILDLYFNHMRELNNTFEVFADEMMSNMTHFFEFDEEEIEL